MSVQTRRNRKNARRTDAFSPDAPEGNDEIKDRDSWAWMPSVQTAFKLLLSSRLCAAMWSNISDCDEVFNYWEPMHFLLYGYGFQTWEYSPLFAIRSYAYLWLHAAPLKLYAAVAEMPKILPFYFLRCIFALICALCETYFYKSLRKQYNPNVARLTVLFLVFGTGMHIASTAFLPSTFAMYMTMLAFGSWFTGDYPLAVFSIAASSILGWPFAAAIGLPIAFDLVIRWGHVWQMIKWSMVSAFILLVPTIFIDSHYFGGIVIAPLNIVLYNVFSDHGPDLYGIESWTFYFQNGFLNLNLVFLMALISLPLVMLVGLFMKSPTRDIPQWLSLSAMYIWFFIFFTQPHKEERFLFPVYPLICVSGAVTMDLIQKVWSKLFSSSSRSPLSTSSNYLAAALCVVYAVISVSRGLALYNGYHAPLDVYQKFLEVSQESNIHQKYPDTTVNVCVGKEWYRFPSNFLLPGDNWRLQFLKSEFRGQLPKPYSGGTDATRKIPSHMNDMNREENSRYIDITQCHYIVDIDVPIETKYEPRYSQISKDWNVVASFPFLDASRSHPIYRAFYIPFVSSQHTVYNDYNILQTVHVNRFTKKYMNSFAINLDEEL